MAEAQERGGSEEVKGNCWVTSLLYVCCDGCTAMSTRQNSLREHLKRVVCENSISMLFKGPTSDVCAYAPLTSLR